MHHLLYLILTLLLLVACNSMPLTPPPATSTPLPSSTATIQPYSQIAQLNDHQGTVYSMDWSPDGKLLVSGGNDGRLIIWDVKSKTVVLKIKTANGIWGVSWSPDGKQIATAGFGGGKIWDAQSGEKLQAISGPGTLAHSIDWSPDGKSIALGYSKGEVAIFDSQSAQLLHEWPGHQENGMTTHAITMAWSPDGKLLVSGGLDGTVRFWDPNNGLTGAVLRFDGQTPNEINGIAWSPNGKLLAVVGKDGVSRLWDVPNERIVMELGKPHSAWLRGVDWSSDGKLLATAGADKLVHIWDTTNGENIANLSGHNSPVWSLAWSPDGKIIATGSGLYSINDGDNSIRLWSIP